MISNYKYFVFLSPYSSSSFCTRNKRSFVVFLFSLRYLLGVPPVSCLNAFSKFKTLLYPQECAIYSIEKSVNVSCSFALEIRNFVKKAFGEIFRLFFKNSIQITSVQSQIIRYIIYRNPLRIIILDIINRLLNMHTFRCIIFKLPQCNFSCKNRKKNRTIFPVNNINSLLLILYVSTWKILFL